MNDAEFDELSFPQKESVLRLVRALEKVERDRENGVPSIPAEQVIAKMKAVVEEQRRKQNRE